MSRSTLLSLILVLSPALPSTLKAQEATPLPATRSPGPQNPTQPVTGRKVGVPTVDGQQPADSPLPNVPPPQAPIREIPQSPPPAPAIPVSDSLKTAEQREYESAMRDRLDSLIKEIDALNARAHPTDRTRQKIFESMLQTAAGNRSVARTKLKQLKFAPPSQWTTLRTDIDKAFVNLEESVSGAKSYLGAP